MRLLYKLSNIFSALLLLVLVIGGVNESKAQNIIPSFGSARSGTSGFQFVKISVDPRSAAMGNSASADVFDASALYWNPAMAIQIGKSQYMASQTSYFVGINQYYSAYVHRLKNTAIGFSLQFLDSGEIDETTEFKPFGTGRTFRTLHYTLGLSVSQKLTDLFSYGITAKFMHERIEEIETMTGAIDFGFFYKVGDTGLRFTVSVNNFGFDATPSGKTERLTLNGNVIEDTFEDVTPPTTFLLGTAYDLFSNEIFDVTVTAQLNNPSDNAERFAIGAEVGFMNKIYGRTGYEFGVEEIKLPSFGVGVKQEVSGYIIAADVGYTVYERLGNITRFGFNISF